MTREPSGQPHTAHTQLGGQQAGTAGEAAWEGVVRPGGGGSTSVWVTVMIFVIGGGWSWLTMEERRSLQWPVELLRPAPASLTLPP